MKKIAYLAIFPIAVLAISLLIYSCGTLNRTCPTAKIESRVKSDSIKSGFLPVLNSGVDNGIAKVTSYRRGKVSRVITRENSFVVRGQILYVLDDSAIWEKIYATNYRLRSEMDMSENYKYSSTSSQNALVAYMNSRRRIQELSDLRNQLYRELSEMRVRAPFSGTLGTSKVKPGEMVYPGSVMNEIIKQGEGQPQQMGVLAAR